MHTNSFLVVLSIVSIVLCSNFKANTTSRKIIDSYNRTRIFHGVNTVYKLFPYYPNYEYFDSNFSLCPVDFANLQSWGFTMIRLHVAWEGVEPQPSQYNITYLQQLLNIVNIAQEYGISVLLDSHQDLLNRQFCGEGWPDWAVVKTNFPHPLQVNLTYDENGIPTTESCLQKEFSEYYASYDVTNNLLRMFTNQDGIADSFAAMWAYVAKFFAGVPNILGYELMNEPFPMGLYKDIFTLLPTGFADENFLFSFYQKITNSIRTVDPKTMIFFEPMTLDLWKVGFPQTPGGKKNLDKQVFSYHIYCGLVTAEGVPINPTFCHFQDYTFIKSREHYVAQDLLIPTFVTEFGAISDSQAGCDELTFLTAHFDSFLTSWSYWQFKYYYDITTAARPPTVESFYNNDGSLQTAKVQTLSRPYGYAFCGNLTKNIFNNETTTLHIIYTPSANCGGANTEVFLSNNFYYADGFNAIFTQCFGCQLQPINGKPQYYEIILPQTWFWGSELELFVYKDQI